MFPLMEQYTFTARQVIDITGISRTVLADLIRRGIVKPSKHRGEGKGDNHLFDIADVFGIAAIQFLRPRAETTNLLRKMFEFWHGPEGEQIVQGKHKAAKAVVVDGVGNVTAEEHKTIAALMEHCESPMLYVIDPAKFRGRVFHEVALYRVPGDHQQLSLNGREPRTEGSKEKQRKTIAKKKKREQLNAEKSSAKAKTRRP